MSQMLQCMEGREVRRWREEFGRSPFVADGGASSAAISAALPELGVVLLINDSTQPTPALLQLNLKTSVKESARTKFDAQIGPRALGKSSGNEAAMDLWTHLWRGIRFVARFRAFSGGRISRGLRPGKATAMYPFFPLFQSRFNGDFNGDFNGI